MVNYIISGGPCTGKSSVVEALGKLGYNVVNEVSRTVANSDERFAGKSVKEINHDLFQGAIFEFQKKVFGGLGDGVFFFDCGVGDSLAYRKFRGVSIGQDILDFAKEVRHDKIFILDVLDHYEQDELRKETREDQKIVHGFIIEAYRKLGHDIIFVPAMSVKDRVRFILDRVDDDRETLK
jgi:predicted ATPase